MINTMSHILFTLCFLTTCRSSPIEQQGKTCGIGEFLTPDDICQSCPDSFYNDRDVHAYRTCFPCTKSETLLHALEIQNCTSRIDTFIVRCEMNYYKRRTYDHRIECGECPTDGCRQEPDCCDFNDSTAVTVGGTSSKPASPTASPSNVSMAAPEWSGSNQTHPNAPRCDDVCVYSDGQVGEEMVNVTCQRVDGPVTVLVECRFCHTNITYDNKTHRCPGDEKKLSPDIIGVVSAVVTAMVILAIVLTAYCCLKKPYLKYMRASSKPDT